MILDGEKLQTWHTTSNVLLQIEPCPNLNECVDGSKDWVGDFARLESVQWLTRASLTLQTGRL